MPLPDLLGLPAPGGAGPGCAASRAPRSRPGVAVRCLSSAATEPRPAAALLRSKKTGAEGCRGAPHAVQVLVDLLAALVEPPDLVQVPEGEALGRRWKLLRAAGRCEGLPLARPAWQLQVGGALPFDLWAGAPRLPRRQRGCCGCGGVCAGALLGGSVLPAGGAQGGHRGHLALGAVQPAAGALVAHAHDRAGLGQGAV